MPNRVEQSFGANVWGILELSEFPPRGLGFRVIGFRVIGFRV